MRTAQECAPKTCTCGRRLGKPEYGYAWPKPMILSSCTLVFSDHKAPIREKTWHIKCKCNLVMVWQFHEKSNGCWKVRSIHPLLDTEEILTIA